MLTKGEELLSADIFLCGGGISSSTTPTPPHDITVPFSYAAREQKPSSQHAEKHGTILLQPWLVGLI